MFEAQARYAKTHGDIVDDSWMLAYSDDLNFYAPFCAYKWEAWDEENRGPKPAPGFFSPEPQRRRRASSTVRKVPS